MIFYDFEVFKHDWLVHFIDVINQVEKTIVNDRDELIEYYEKNSTNLWIGFNNLHYDQFIFKGILLGMNPTDINDFIINQKNPEWKYSDAFWRLELNQYDVFSGFNGLKQLEAFMGHNIMETSVPFNIDRKLTDEELQDVIKYCKYDVEQTIEVFLRRQGEFNSKMDLIKEFNLPLSNISKTNAQLSAEVLDAVKQTRRDEFDLDFPEEMRVNKYKDIVRWYQNPVNHDYTKKLEVDVAGVPHIFAWGGLHGARDNYIKEGKFVLVDVSSYYPSLMIQYDYMSRNISDKSNFSDMYDERFKLKKAKDPKEGIFKLILNTTYGCMGYKFNKLHDQRMRNNVCVTGQLLLLDLLESFEKVRGIEVVQSNTDGILLRYETDNQLNKIKEISTEWSERTRLNLDYDYFYKIIQKDVNNYIALGEDYNVFVGGYVKDLDELDYDLPVVNKAIREYFINGTSPEEYIGKENRLIEFQKVVKISNKYDYAIHNERQLQEKTIRVFASKDPNDSEVLKYRKLEDGKEQYVKFANTSTTSFVDNGYIKDKTIPRKLDKQWYIDLTWRRIKQFIGEEK